MPMDKKVRTNSLGGGAVALTIAKGITIILNMLTGMLLSRFRSVEEYGTYSQLLLTISLVSSLIMLGLPNSINFFLARAETPLERKGFLSTYYTVSTFLAAFMGGMLLLAIPLIEQYFGNNQIKDFDYFLLLYPWTAVTIASVANLLVVYGRTKRLMVFNIAHSVVTLVSVLVAKWLGLNFQWYMKFLLAGQIAITLWVFLQLHSLERGIRPKVEWALLKRVFSYSIPLGLAAFVGTITVDVDKLMIGHFLGTEEMAYYTNAGKELPLTLLSTSLTAVLLPQIAILNKKNQGKDAIALWGTAIKLGYLVLCFFVTACVVFAPQIITVLYSEKYLMGAPIFCIYSLVLLFRVTYFGMMLSATGRTKAILWTSILTMVLNMVLNWLLYAWLGFVGPALATLVSIAAVQIIQLILTAKEMKCTFWAVFPWSFCGKCTLLNALWGTPIYLLVRFLKFGVSMTDIAICIGIGAVVAVIYAFCVRKKAMNLWRALNAAKQYQTNDSI